jgi:anti-sigma factor RsiW
MCNDYLDLLPLLGSGELSEAEERTLRAHLRTCAACRQEAARLEPVAALIGQPPTAGWSANVVPAVRARLAARAAQHPATLGLRPAFPGAPFVSARTGRPGWATWATLGAVGAALLVALLVGLAGLMQPHPQLGATDAGTQTATASPAGTRTVVPIPAGLLSLPTMGAQPAAAARQVRWVSDDHAGRPPAPDAFPTPGAASPVTLTQRDQ